MAEFAPPRLRFERGCPDPGQREVDLPDPLPEIGDDFDWRQGDFPSFRDAMLRELALRFPERRRWAVADLEVVLVEMLSAVLDQLTDTGDRIAAESVLETARRPETVARWLSFIGVLPAQIAPAGLPATAPAPSDDEVLESIAPRWRPLVEHWRANPHEMERARRMGPASIRVQRRMVSLDDYGRRLEEHPLVERAAATRQWGGSWSVVRITLSFWNDMELDSAVATAEGHVIPRRLRDATDAFHRQRGLVDPEWSSRETLRDIIDKYLREYRSIGQPVELLEIMPIGIDLTLCVRVEAQYFQSEVRREVLRGLGRGPSGFFAAGRLRFGEDVRASDLYQRIMQLDGVETVDLQVLKKVGSLHPNRAREGYIALARGELAVCNNNTQTRERGLIRVSVTGGRRGMTNGRDFTRWNRAGLRRFEYVDGNAATYLERLRQELRLRFEDRWNALPSPPDISDEAQAQPELAAHQRNRQVVEQYEASPGDVGWELARTFCRACHVLTGHVDAHANEAFLRTATQWESVRRLAAMLDYQAAGPTSASTTLVLEAKPDRRGVLPRGFQVKYTPTEGGPQVVFETLSDLEIDSALDDLRPRGAEQSPAPLLSDGRSAVALSALAHAPVDHIRGIGPVWTSALDGLGGPGSPPFEIKDLAALDPHRPGLAEHLGMPLPSLAATQAKARVVVDFEVDASWATALGDWWLTDITAASSDRLAALVTDPSPGAEEFREYVGLLVACLDDAVSRSTPLVDLIPARVVPPVPDSEPTPEPLVTSTPWVTPRKPKVSAGELAMVFHEGERRGEAVRIAGAAPEQPVQLQPIPEQFTWARWPRGLTRLHVTPRAERRAWLNGPGIVRTVAAHGLSAGAFVAWRADERWRFAEVEEADAFGLRLRVEGALPPAGTRLYEAHPLEPPHVPKDMTLGAVDESAMAQLIEEQITEVTFATLLPKEGEDDWIFRVENPSEDAFGVPLPPGGLELGSFLFPSPMLPMDLVKAAVELLLSIGAMVIPSTGEPVFKFSISLDAMSVQLVDQLEVSDAIVVWNPKYVNDSLPEFEKTERKKEVVRARLAGTRQLPTDSADDVVLFKVLEQTLLEALEHSGPLLGLRKGPPVKAVTTTVDPLYILDGTADELGSGQWVVAEYAAGPRAVTVRSLLPATRHEGAKAFGISFDGATGELGPLLRIHADFRGLLEPEGARENATPIESADIELDEVPELLSPGRLVLLTTTDDATPPALATITTVDDTTVTLDPLPLGLTRGNVRIHGNVVTASHGFTAATKVLSSGTGTSQVEALLLEVENVSTVEDPTFPTGVRPDVEVVIDGMRWTQVPRLDHSAPADPHYVARATEERFLRLVFGDGMRGRRLPPGSNNVRISYRVGAGRAGNLDPGRLTKPVHPHPLVRAVKQPMVSVGGEEQEPLETVQARAPGTLLALERCVSLRDFENLATSRADVWQARASLHRSGGGRYDLVRVVVVPSGGKPFDAAAPLARDVAEFLGRHAIPDVAVRVDSYRPQPIHLQVGFRVDLERYDPLEVEERARTRIGEAFSLERRTIGLPLYLSEVYEVVEAVTGVQDSVCNFVGAPEGLHIRPTGEDSVVHLGLEATALLLKWEAYEP